MDISRHLAALFAGNTRTSMLPTFVVALAVTALVAVPLTSRAVDARNADEPATVTAAAAEAVMVDTAGAERRPLDRQTIGGNALISFTDPSATGVAFNLLPQGQSTPVLTSADIKGPHFDLVPSDDGSGLPLDTTLLANGSYELFMSVSSADGEQRTAVVFDVSNP